jgi:hypothetical protein
MGETHRLSFTQETWKGLQRTILLTPNYVTLLKEWKDFCIDLTKIYTNNFSVVNLKLSRIFMQLSGQK